MTIPLFVESLAFKKLFSFLFVNQLSTPPNHQSPFVPQNIQSSSSSHSRSSCSSHSSSSISSSAPSSHPSSFVSSSFASSSSSSCSSSSSSCTTRSSILDLHIELLDSAIDYNPHTNPGRLILSADRITASVTASKVDVFVLPSFS